MTNIKKPIILVKKVTHRNNIQLLLIFKYNETLKTTLKNLNYSWSKTLKGWYIKYTKENISQLKKQFKDIAILKMDVSVLQKQQEKPTQINPRSISQKKQVLQLYATFLKGKSVNESVIKTNIAIITYLVDFIAEKPLISLTNTVAETAFKSINNNNYTAKQCINALKLFKMFYPECAIEPDKIEIF